MVILGIDPGARATGYGFLTGTGAAVSYLEAGVIRPPAKMPLAERLLVLDRALRDLVSRHKPAEAAVESLFHAQSPRTAIVLGHARGIALLAAASCGARVVEYAPLEVKMAVTGTGGASKQQVRAMVRRLITVPPRLALDAADALAVALCHVYRRQSRAVLSRAAAEEPRGSR